MRKGNGSEGGIFSFQRMWIEGIRGENSEGETRERERGGEKMFSLVCTVYLYLVTDTALTELKDTIF